MPDAEKDVPDFDRPCTDASDFEAMGREVGRRLRAAHEQVHRPATGDSECTCGQWVGPMTVIPESDPRSFAAHVASVLPPGVGA